MDQPASLSQTGLTVKISTCSTNAANVASTSDLKSSVESSPYSSPSIISPPPSAYVSALQSPYISPRATVTPNPQENSTTETSQRSSQLDGIPSSSYTPPSDQYEYSDGPAEAAKLKYVTDPAPPRVSFTFPAPRVSFRGSVSPGSNAKLRSCDVFIGFHGQNPNLIRFCKWLKSELEQQGIACFVADRAKYSDQSQDIADRIISSVAYGVVVVTNSTFVNHLSLEEIRFFAQKKNLIPLFFGTSPSEIKGHHYCNSIDKGRKEAIDGLLNSPDYKLEANESNWRNCVAKVSGLLRAKLGRTSVAEKDVVEPLEELPFPRNRYFVGIEKEIKEIESVFFGCGDTIEKNHPVPTVKGEYTSQSEGLETEESEEATDKGDQYINIELRGHCKEPVTGRNSMKRSKYKKPKSSSCKTLGSISVLCINGIAGTGKTDLVLEFAYRYSQRYQMVFWIGGEARYFRQNILNLSLNLGLDVSADGEKERDRIRSFEEQESDAFKRVKRELFREIPYLLIIDNLETETEWWDGKDLFDFVPRNTGGSHVIITTRLPKVMNFNSKHLPPLSFAEAVALIRGRRKKDYPNEELEFLRKFDDKLGRLSFGLSVVGSLLSELSIAPSALFEAVNQVPYEDGSAYSSINDEQYCKSNPFLMKLLRFCLILLQHSKSPKNNLALRMLLVGVWFAPAPISASLLATAAKDMTAVENRFEKWTKGLSLAFGCCLGCGIAPQSEEDSANLLVKLGLAQKVNKQPGLWIQFHPITQVFGRRKEGFSAAKATVHGVRNIDNLSINFDHLWASAFLVFGFKSEPPLVQLKAVDTVLYIKKTALPLALKAFTNFSRCNSALELLKVCTNVLEEAEKSFVSQVQDWCHGSLCWKKKKKLQGQQKVDEYVWRDVTLLKATLLETQAKLLLRGGHFDSGEKLCRTCISIRTVMLGHNHAQTLDRCRDGRGKK